MEIFGSITYVYYVEAVRTYVGRMQPVCAVCTDEGVIREIQ